MSTSTPDGVIKKLKRVAKQWRRENPSFSQANALDEIAAAFGYNNWSLLSKNVNKMNQAQLSSFHDGLYAHPQFVGYLPLVSSTVPTAPAAPTFDRAAAIEEMTEWVESNYTPLNEFAVYDSESENGFAARSEDLVEALQDEFSDRFPLSLIEELGIELELDRGPWGDEDFGYE
jgi:hypothetical protein